ncbi:MAG: hypothetical protein M3302_05040, partial [Actinomycetota bacterium]|nr:hypothetical protein [Actinomycetota bacterium]
SSEMHFLASSASPMPVLPLLHGAELAARISPCTGRCPNPMSTPLRGVSLGHVSHRATRVASATGTNTAASKILTRREAGGAGPCPP